MTNQQNLEAIIARAQERGWMQWFYLTVENYTDRKSKEKKIVKDFVFQAMTEDCFIKLSLNDILFGTDFCEKFFRNIELCKPCNHVLAACEYGNAPLCHKIDMLSMTEPERIDFLYKHVEGEEKYIFQSNTTIQKEEYKKEIENPFGLSKLEEKGSFQIEPCCENGDIIVAHTCMKQNPVEVKEIEPIPYKEYSGSVTQVVQSVTGDLTFKINELITQVNANTKDIRDCKLNKN